MEGRTFGALIVDFGGVLTTPLQDSMVRFATEVGIELQDLVRAALRGYVDGKDDLVTAFETGRMSQEEFSREFASRLKSETGKDVSSEGLVARLFGGLSLEEDMMAAVVKARRSGYKTALLSNSWGLEGYPRHRFEEMFDVVIISGEVGMRKPDRDIFDLTVQRLNVPASACVFVDDHPGHLKAAIEHGMTTVLHRSAQDTIAELESLLEIELSA